MNRHVFVMISKNAKQKSKALILNKIPVFITGPILFFCGEKKRKETLKKKFLLPTDQIFFFSILAETQQFFTPNWKFTGCQVPHLLMVLIPYINSLNLSWIKKKMSIIFRNMEPVTNSQVVFYLKLYRTIIEPTGILSGKLINRIPVGSITVRYRF